MASQHNIVIKHAFGLANSITVSVNQGNFFFTLFSLFSFFWAAFLTLFHCFPLFLQLLAGGASLRSWKQRKRSDWDKNLLWLECFGFLRFCCHRHHQHHHYQEHQHTAISSLLRTLFLRWASFLQKNKVDQYSSAHRTQRLHVEQVLHQLQGWIPTGRHF